MIELINNYWALEVSKSADRFAIHKHLLYYEVPESESWTGDTQVIIDLPSGPWQIVCTSKATEEQAATVVQLISNGKLTGRPQYRRYDRDPVKDTPARSWTRDSRHALETLLTSKGCDLKLNWLILKKQDAHT